jgi:hypothetical protein
MKPYGFEGKITVVVGTITDDQRIYEIPKMTVSWLEVVWGQTFPSKHLTCHQRRTETGRQHIWAVNNNFRLGLSSNKSVIIR